MSLSRVLSLRVGLSLMPLLLFCGCHDSGNGVGPRVPLSALTLTVTPSGLSIPAGGGGYVTVTATRTGSFLTQAITLTLDGCPTGVIGSGTLAANAHTGQFAFQVAANVAPQTLETLKVKATVEGRAYTVPFRLVIAPPLPLGQIRADLVQASGGTQRAGAMENTSVTLEPMVATPATSPTGSIEVRHGFNPTAKPTVNPK